MNKRFLLALFAIALLMPGIIVTAQDEVVTVTWRAGVRYPRMGVRRSGRD